MDFLMSHGTDLAEDNRDFPWKHGFPTAPVYRRDVLYIVCVRNALDWITSLFKRPHQMAKGQWEMSFADFIRSEWKADFAKAVLSGGIAPRKSKKLYGAETGQPLNFDVHPVDGRYFRNPIELRNVKLAAHLSMLQRAPNAAVVKLEDLAAGHGLTLCRLSESFGFALPTTLPEVPDNLGHFGVTPDWRNSQVKTISHLDRDFIVNQLDQRTEEAAGYSYAG